MVNTWKRIIDLTIGMASLSRLSLNERLLAILLIPTFTMVLLLVGYNIQQHLNKINQSENQSIIRAVHEIKALLNHRSLTNNEINNSINLLLINNKSYKNIKNIEIYQDQFLQEKNSRDLQCKTPTNPIIRTIAIEQYLKAISFWDFRNRDQRTYLNIAIPNVDTHDGCKNFISLELTNDHVILEKYNHIAKNIVLIGSVFLIIGFISSKVSRKISTPLIQLEKAIQKINYDNPHENIKIEGSREINKITDGLNRINRRLQNIELEYHEQIQEETKKLQDDIQQIENLNHTIIEIQKSATINDKLKTRLLSEISNRLLIPSVGIISFANLLGRTKITKQQSDYLKIINSSASEVKNIMTNIIICNEIEKDKNNDISEFNIRDLIEDIITITAPAALDKKLSIQHQVCQTIPNRLIGNPITIRKIVFNLLINSIKYTHKGFIIISAKSISSFSDKISIEISITDSGIGINEEQRPLIFSQIKYSNKIKNKTDKLIFNNNKFENNQTNLTITKSLINSIDGNISFDSEIDNGTNFRLNINLDTLNKKLVKVDDHITIDSNSNRIFIIDQYLIRGKDISNILDDYDIKHTLLESIDNLKHLLESDISDHRFNNILVIIQFDVLDIQFTCFVNTMTVLTKIGVKFICTINSNDFTSFPENSNIEIINQPLTKNKLLNILSIATNSPPTNIVENINNESIKLLLIDNHPIRSKIVSHILANYKSNLIHVNSLESAKIYLDIQKVDIILIGESSSLEENSKIFELINNIKKPYLFLKHHNFHFNEKDNDDIFINKDDTIFKEISFPITRKVLMSEIENFINKINNINKSMTSHDNFVFQARSRYKNEKRVLSENYVVKKDIKDMKIFNIELSIQLADNNNKLATEIFRRFIDLLQDDIDLLVKYWQNDEYQHIDGLVYELYLSSHYCGVTRLSHSLEQYLLHSRSNEYSETTAIDHNLKSILFEVDSLLIWQWRHNWLELLKAQRTTNAKA